MCLQSWSCLYSLAMTLYCELIFLLILHEERHDKIPGCVAFASSCLCVSNLFSFSQSSSLCAALINSPFSQPVCNVVSYICFIFAKLTVIPIEVCDSWSTWISLDVRNLNLSGRPLKFIMHEHLELINSLQMRPSSAFFRHLDTEMVRVLHTLMSNYSSVCLQLCTWSYTYMADLGWS